MKSLEAVIEQARDKTATRSQRHRAFGNLVIRFEAAAYRWAVDRLQEPMLAQDVVQESFVIAYQKLHMLKESKAFAGWLRQIVISQCGRQLRGQKTAVESIEATDDLANGLFSSPSSPEHFLEKLEMEQRVMAAIHRLPVHEREVTDLFYLWGYSQNEIAKILEIPVTTVKKRLQYARRNLKGILVSMVDSLYGEPTPQPIPIPVRVHPPRRQSKQGH
jgi:RNA polymerase sigma factor (sigma-70 family)